MEHFASCFDHRRAGVLLHITSLPGHDSCGSLGREAHNFVDFLAAAGFSVWQMLPVGPTGPDGSPYQSSSAHAGDPRLIDLDWLRKQGWLSASTVINADTPKFSILSASWEIFRAQSDQKWHKLFQNFIDAHEWVDDYALFHAMHLEFQAGWWEWPAPLRDRNSSALSTARIRYAKVIDVLKYEQFIFATQWKELREYANSRGVLLFGDMPIFVAHDSAEVWAKPQYFDLNQDGSPRVVAGVPPDYFSATGQRWGNPLYHWERMRADGFSFWIQRMRTQLELFDLIRIDHFRGFESYWEIPAQEPNAIHGSWVRVDGDALFAKLRQVFSHLPLVAEDLGIITPEVTALRCRHALPGMKVLQFAFSGGADNPYLPFRHTIDSVVYTGTHDNDTSLGWYQSLNNEAKRVVDGFLGWPKEPMPKPLIRAAFGSVAQLAIIPIQDLLGLGSEHRMNTPGTTQNNWRWRLSWNWVPINLAGELRELIAGYGRLIK